MRDRDEYDELIDRMRQKRLRETFAQLERRERQLLTAALAGNCPECLSDCREPVIRALAWADSHAQ